MLTHLARLFEHSRARCCCCQTVSAIRPSAAEDGADRDKVAAVCGALRAAMQAAGQRRHLGPILTSHAKQGNVEAALAIVKELKEEQLADAQAQRKPSRTPHSGAAIFATGDAAGDSKPDGTPGPAPEATAAAGTSAAAGAISESTAQSAATANSPIFSNSDRLDTGAGAVEGHKSWTAEDGLRHLLLYSDVDRLYRCRR